MLRIADPEQESLWRGLPFWLLVPVQWILALGISIPIVFVFSLLWPVACMYYYNVAKTLGNDVQFLLAIIGLVFAVMLFPIVAVVTLLLSIIMWFAWIVRDIKAIVKRVSRPDMLPEKYQGLYGFVN